MRTYALKKSVSVALLAVGSLTFLALTFRPVIEGDGIGYYSYLHAVVIGHDLSFTDEYAAAERAHVALWPSLLETPTATGKLANFFPVGPALLSLPAYLAALVMQPSGEPQYGGLFATTFTLASLAFGLLALGLMYRLCGSAVAVFAAVACTPLAFYLLTDPSYSHTFSVFTVTAFVLAWWRLRETRGVWGWVGLGFLGGLMALTRWQDGLLTAVVLVDLPKARGRLLLMFPGLLLGFLPQAVVDLMVFGTWLPQRPPGQGLSPWPGHYREVLFSSSRGLFVWHPITIVATAGFLLLRDRALKLACVGALVAEVLIDGALPDWSGGLAFGARRLLDLLPFWALGLAAVARRLGPALSWVAAGALAGWNALLVAAFDYTMRGDKDPGYLGLLLGQRHAIRYLPHLLLQGAVVRDLALWPLLRRPHSTGAGIGMLAGEAVCVAAALAAVYWRRRGSMSAASVASHDLPQLSVDPHSSQVRALHDSPAPQPLEEFPGPVEAFHLNGDTTELREGVRVGAGNLSRPQDLAEVGGLPVGPVVGTAAAEPIAGVGQIDEATLLPDP